MTRRRKRNGPAPPGSGDRAKNIVSFEQPDEPEIMQSSRQCNLSKTGQAKSAGSVVDSGGGRARPTSVPEIARHDTCKSKGCVGKLTIPASPHDQADPVPARKGELPGTGRRTLATAYPAPANTTKPVYGIGHNGGPPLDDTDEVEAELRQGQSDA
jgi:hypothetical protein